MMPTLTKQPSHAPGDDPWWDYYDGDATHVEALLADCARRSGAAAMIARSWRSRCVCSIDGRRDAADLLGARRRHPRRRPRHRFSRRPMRGLTAADFVIRDNGVPQQVDVVSFGETSLNVGLAFDLSESVAGAPLDRLRAASKALTSALQPRRSTRARHLRSRRHDAMRASLESRVRERRTRRSHADRRDGARRRCVCRNDGRRIGCRPIAADGVQRRLDTASFLDTDRVLDMGTPLGRRRLSDRVEGRAAGFSRGARRAHRRPPARVGLRTTISRRPSARSSTNSATVTSSPTRRRTCRRTAGTSSR